MTAPSAGDLMFRSVSGHGGYALTALAREAEAVAGAAPGSRNAALNKAAHALGGLVAGGHLDHARVEQRLTEAALAVGLDAIEARGTIASGLRAGSRRPRDVPDQANQQRRELPPLGPRRREPEPHDAAAERRRNEARRIWLETGALAGTLSDLWLADRGIRFAPHSVIRHHPALPYWRDGGEIARWPAMVVRMDAPDGSFSGVHRTYLDSIIDGGPVRKAPVEPARTMLGPAGIAWFGRRDAAAIIVGEGVETVLAAAELGGANLPLWGCCAVPDAEESVPVPEVPQEPYGLTPVACFTAGGVKEFDPPSAVRRLFICEDADDAGRGATAKLAARAHARDIAVSILRCRGRADGC